MARTLSDAEAWKKMVLRSMAPPAWLGPDAPEGDVVISTRVRYARNLRGYRFPHHATLEELRAVQRMVRQAADHPELRLETHKRLTEAERDYLLGCRLISPEFAHREHGRMVLLDERRSVSVMVNEEDHIRLQALSAGWSPETAAHHASTVLHRLSETLEFAHDERWGYLTSSPYNVGGAQRRSALFHLIGLAHTKRLAAVIGALAQERLAARGLFGESSRAVGALFQVSATSGSDSAFRGACEYLIGQERAARREVPRSELSERARSAVAFAIASVEISLADALRVLAWVRWAATAELEEFSASPREVDGWASTLEVRGTSGEQRANRDRASYLRQRLE